MSFGSSGRVPKKRNSPTFSPGTNLLASARYVPSSETGAVLWKFRTNSGVTAVPASYSIEGKQYIAVQSGWGVDAQRMQDGLDKIYNTKTDVPQGGMLWVFALD